MRQLWHTIVLHAHLPFVRHPEHPDFLEEDWLYEAVVETYLPLIEGLGRLVDEGCRFRLTMTVSPTLLSMLADPLLQQRCGRTLDRLADLTEREVWRTKSDPTLAPVTRFYRDRIDRLRRRWWSLRGNLIDALVQLETAGAIETLTCGATHGFLPLIGPPQAARAQLAVAVATHRRILGRMPQGIWLPECGYTPGLDRQLAEVGLRYFVVDTHGLRDARPRPHFVPYAPLFTPAGPAAFGRDQHSGMQVWSSEHGYPGDPLYREFYRDIGFDLPLDHLGPFVQPTGERKGTGLKYHRITGKVPLPHKQVYDPEAALRRAHDHGIHFADARQAQLTALGGAMPVDPIVVSPYDAELFGHWWFEGPHFIESYIRESCRRGLWRVASPTEYLAQNPVQQIAEPPYCSWGAGGYAAVWLDRCNDWMYPHLHRASERMIGLARTHVTPPPQIDRALQQAARELLLAQSSDWAFILRTGTMVPYAERRFRDHLHRFNALADQIDRNEIDPVALGEWESRDNLFPQIDYRVYA